MLIETKIKNQILNTISKKYPGIKKIKTEEKLFNERINNDINDIIYRAIKGEYYLKDFSSKSRFDTHGRMREFYIYLESYTNIGKSRGKIFQSIGTTNTSKILNIGPGRSPKIELGLFYENFQGSVYICDINKKSAGYIKRFMDIFGYGFHIKQKTYNFLEGHKGKYNIIVGNHIIDDLIVGFLLSNRNISLEEYYNNENIESMTKNLLYSVKKNEIDIIIQIITKQIDLHLLDNGYIVLNHYKSYIDDLCDNNLLYQFMKKIIIQIKKILSEYGYEELKVNGLSKIYFKNNNYFILNKKKNAR